MYNNSNSKLNDTMITLHQIFDTALFLFGKIWPAAGAFFVCIGIIACISGLCALWDACDPTRPKEWSDWES